MSNFLLIASSSLRSEQVAQHLPNFILTYPRAESQVQNIWKTCFAAWYLWVEKVFSSIQSKIYLFLLVTTAYHSSIMYHSKEPDIISDELLTGAKKLLLGSPSCYLFFRMSKSQSLSLFSQENFSIPDQFKVSLPSLIQFVSGFPGRGGHGVIKAGCST